MFLCQISYCLDKSDKGEESEEEICAETPGAAKTPQKRNNDSRNQDSEDYGGSTDVDDPDTEDEIEMIKKKMKAENGGSSRGSDEPQGNHNNTD